MTEQYMDMIETAREEYRSFIQKQKDKVVAEIVGLFEEYIDSYLKHRYSTKLYSAIRPGLEKDIREILNKKFFRTYDT